MLDHPDYLSLVRYIEDRRASGRVPADNTPDGWIAAVRADREAGRRTYRGALRHRWFVSALDAARDLEADAPRRTAPMSDLDARRAGVLVRHRPLIDMAEVHCGWGVR